MFKRLLPALATLLATRATRKVAGRNAALVTLAFGMFELWRNYQRTSASAQPQAKGRQRPASARSTDRPSHRRRKRP